CLPRLRLVSHRAAAALGADRVVVVLAASGGHHLITYFQAIVIGLLQGVTELFPISSLGHAVILPKLFGWNLNQKEPYYLAFLVATHLATAIVLFLFFLREWVRILRGLGRSLRDRQIAPDDADARLAWPLVVGTTPAGLRGPALAGAVCAGLAAWASVNFLMRYFETNRLTPFAWYCLIAGFAALLVFVL